LSFHLAEGGGVCFRGRDTELGTFVHKHVKLFGT